MTFSAVSPAPPPLLELGAASDEDGESCEEYPEGEDGAYDVAAAFTALAGSATVRLAKLGFDGARLDKLRRRTSCGSWAAALRAAIGCDTHEERGALRGALRGGDEHRRGGAEYAVAARAGAGGTAPKLAIRAGNIGELASSGGGGSSGTGAGLTVGSRPVVVAGRKRACSDASEASAGDCSPEPASSLQ